MLLAYIYLAEGRGVHVVEGGVNVAEGGVPVDGPLKKKNSPSPCKPNPAKRSHKFPVKLSPEYPLFDYLIAAIGRALEPKECSRNPPTRIAPLCLSTHTQPRFSPGQSPESSGEGCDLPPHKVIDSCVSVVMYLYGYLCVCEREKGEGWRFCMDGFGFFLTSVLYSEFVC